MLASGRDKEFKTGPPFETGGQLGLLLFTTAAGAYTVAGAVLLPGGG